MEGGGGTDIVCEEKERKVLNIAKSQNGRRAGGRSLHEGRGQEVKGKGVSTKGQRAGEKGKEAKGHEGERQDTKGKRLGAGCEGKEAKEKRSRGTRAECRRQRERGKIQQVKGRRQ